MMRKLGGCSAANEEARMRNDERIRARCFMVGNNEQTNLAGKSGVDCEHVDGMEPKVVTFMDDGVQMRLVQQASAITNILCICFDHLNPHAFAFVVLMFGPFICESEDKFYRCAHFETFALFGGGNLVKVGIKPFILGDIFQIKALVFKNRKWMVP